ncbi:hypothetical protein Tco_1140778 [Tanacetum coccineum]
MTHKHLLPLSRIYHPQPHYQILPHLGGQTLKIQYMNSVNWSAPYGLEPLLITVYNTRGGHTVGSDRIAGNVLSKTMAGNSVSKSMEQSSSSS